MKRRALVPIPMNDAQRVMSVHVKAGARPVVDFVPSDSRIKSLDFRFVFPDPSSGIPETIDELCREGCLA